MPATDILQSHLTAYGFVLLRVLAFFSVMPLWGQRVPPLFRVVAAMWFAVLFSFVLPPVNLAVEATLGDLLVGGLHELLMGVVLGLLVQLALAAVTLAGHFIGFQMGLAMARVMDPSSSEQYPIISQFLNLLILFLFVQLDGHLLVVSLLARSFEWIPPFSARLDPALFSHLVTEKGGEMFSTCIRIAWPISITLFLTYLSLGLLNRMTPQMNVLMLGFPVSIMVGFLLLMFMVPSFTAKAGGLLEELALSLDQYLLAMRP